MITLKQWSEVESWVLAAAAQPLEAQERFIDVTCPPAYQALVRFVVDGLNSDKLKKGAVFLGNWVAETTQDEVVLSPPVEQREGDHIGVYQIISVVGQGGMGTVYLAERTGWPHPVAVKVLRYDLVTDQALLRFRWERMMLGALNHPGIVGLLDAGTTADGRPYYVMPYVSGTPLLEYCNQKNLLLSQRLALFTQVCEAIQHAHERGILHRDLKPAHLVVLEREDGLFVRVLDFGIATVYLGQPNNRVEANDITVLSQEGTTPFTPEYAAPEQQQGRRATIATDVFGLGLLLQELTNDLGDRENAPPQTVERLAVIWKRATEQQPGDRFATVKDLIRAIASC